MIPRVKFHEYEPHQLRRKPENGVLSFGRPLLPLELVKHFLEKLKK
jgi:hypothetical protein